MLWFFRDSSDSLMERSRLLSLDSGVQPPWDYGWTSETNIVYVARTKTQENHLPFTAGVLKEPDYRADRLKALERVLAARTRASPGMRYLCVVGSLNDQVLWFGTMASNTLYQRYFLDGGSKTTAVHPDIPNALTVFWGNGDNLFYITRSNGLIVGLVSEELGHLQSMPISASVDLLGVCGNNALAFSSSNGKGNSLIRVRFQHGLSNLLVESWEVEFPPGAIVHSVQPSPEGNLLAWEIRYPEKRLEFLRNRPFVSRRQYADYAVLVSDSQGKQMYEMGRVRKYGYRLGSLKWRPGGNEISFLFGMELYIVKVDDSIGN